MCVNTAEPINVFNVSSQCWAANVAWQKAIVYTATHPSRIVAPDSQGLLFSYKWFFGKAAMNIKGSKLREQLCETRTWCWLLALTPHTKAFLTSILQIPSTGSRFFHRSNYIPNGITAERNIEIWGKYFCREQHNIFNERALCHFCGISMEYFWHNSQATVGRQGRWDLRSKLAPFSTRSFSFL